MKLEEVMKKYKLSCNGFKIRYKDFYGNVYRRIDLPPEEILKIEKLEVRDVSINFITKKVVFSLFDLWELMHEKEGK